MVILTHNEGFSQQRYNYALNVYTKDIHPLLEEQIQAASKDIQAERDAAEDMTNCFNEIKTAMLAGENCFLGPLMNDLKEANASFFNYVGLEGNNDAVGDAFERDVSRIITGVMDTIELGEKNVSADLINIGASQLTVGRQNASPKIIFSEAIAKDVSKVINKDIKNIFAKVKQDGQTIGYRIKKEQAKIDIEGRKGIAKFQGDAGDRLWKFYQELSNATFTAKSYLSTTFSKKGLTLGSTIPFRAFASALSSCYPGITGATLERIFHASINKDVKDPDKVQKHMNHLYMIYELTGMGLYGSGGLNSGLPQYMIVNLRESTTNSSGAIKIMSTRAIIADMLSGDTSFTSLTRTEQGTTSLSFFV